MKQVLTGFFVFFVLILAVFSQSPPVQSENQSTNPRYVWEVLHKQNNLHLLAFRHFDNKTIIAEFADYLAVIESPQNDSLARSIIQYCKQTFSKKPIKYLFHTHHHGHSIAGVDEYLREGTMIVTTASNKKTIESKTRDSNALNRQLLLIDSTFSLQDNRNVLTVHVLKNSHYSVPTTEYMVFEFPRQKTLISGCLYRKPQGRFEVVNARKHAVHKLISNKNLTITTLIPTSSGIVEGFEDISTLASLDSTLQFGMYPDTLANHLRQLPFEYGESRLDSLRSVFFGTHKFEWYDIAVCAYTLKNTYKDPNRALLLLRICLVLYPEKVDVYDAIAECYMDKRCIIEAKRYWDLALEKTKNKEEQQEILDKMKKLLSL